MAGCRRWDVEVKKFDVGVVYFGCNPLEFDVRIAVEGDVDEGERDGVVDDESHSTPSTPGAIFADDVVARESRKARVIV